MDEQPNEDLEEDLLEEQIEKQADIQHDVYDGDTPQFQSKEDLFTLFWKVIKLTESSKVANLDKQELGDIGLTVRDCQKVGFIGHTLQHPGFGNFFNGYGEITLATSMSKKGFLSELFVSQKKAQTKTRLTPEQAGLPVQPQKKKWSLFGNKNSEGS